MKTKITPIRLTLELSARLEALSDSSGFSVSELIRACIHRALPYVENKVQEQDDSPRTSITTNPGPAGAPNPAG